MTESAPNLPAPQLVRLLGADWRVAKYEVDDAGWPIIYLLPTDGLPPAVLALVAGDYLSYFCGRVAERTRVRPISSASIQRLAEILGAVPTREFAFRISDVIVGYAMIAVFGFHSPRFWRELATALEKNPAEVKARYRGDPLVAAVIARVERDVEEVLSARPYESRERHFRLAARHLRDEMRKEIPRGGRKDHAGTLFMQSVVKIAQRYGCDLKLPPHSKDRGGAETTQLLEFADAMRRQLIACSQALGVPGKGDDLNRLSRMTRTGLILALDRARSEAKMRDRSM